MNFFQHILSKSVQKIISKMMMDEYGNKPTMGTSHLGLAGPTTSSQEYSTKSPDERLASKYASRNAKTAGASCHTSGDSGGILSMSIDSSTRASSFLCRQRHEGFPSQSGLISYAERIKQSQNKKPPKLAVDSKDTINNNEPVQKYTTSVNNIPDSTMDSTTNDFMLVETSWDNEESKSKNNNDDSNQQDLLASSSAYSPTSYGSDMHDEKRIHNYSTPKEFHASASSTQDHQDQVKSTNACIVNSDDFERTMLKITILKNYPVTASGVENDSEEVSGDSRKAYDDDFSNKSSDGTDDEYSSIVLSTTSLRENPMPNNDPKVNCHSDYMEECCLCSYKGEHMVQHYVYNHPKKAVYISRVAPEQAELIKADPLGIKGQKMTRHSFRFGNEELVKFRCFFCDLTISESQDLWLDHISGHTGEYRYKCMQCPTVARSSLQRVMHDPVCSNPAIELWHKYTFENNHLYGYLCEKCNFVQVIYENMVHHLREDHADDGTGRKHIICFSLVNFDLQDSNTNVDNGIVKLEPIMDDEGLQYETELMVCEEWSEDEEDKFNMDCTEEQDLIRTDVAAKRETHQQIQLLQGQEQLQELPQLQLPVERLNGTISEGLFSSDPMTYLTNAIISTSTGTAGPTSLSNGGNIVHGPTISPIPTTTAACAPVASGPPRIFNGCIINSQLSQSPPIVTPVIIPQPVSMTALMPWKGKNNAGKISLHKLTREYLVAEYKCTAFDCGFYSDVSKEIQAHIETHQKNPLRLECWYCKCFLRNTQNLVEHIKTRHKYCGYQCDSCCYRSRDPNNVDVHQRKYHYERLATAKILCLLERQKPHNYMDDDAMTNEKKTNVKCIQCAHCHMRKFIDLNAFLTHIEEHNRSHIKCHICSYYVRTQKVAEHLQSHNIFLFECIYCDHGTTSTAMILEHVADEHPERMLFYHTRVSRNNFPLFVRPTLNIPADRYDVETVHLT